MMQEMMSRFRGPGAGARMSARWAEALTMAKQRGLVPNETSVDGFKRSFINNQLRASRGEWVNHFYVGNAL